MTQFIANGHSRNRDYSSFHNSINHKNAHENYALKHLYSQDNLKYFLFDLGWEKTDIEVGIKHCTIDVHRDMVYVHIPGKITKKGVAIKIKGMSRFVSKLTFINILIGKCDRKADPYKLELASWDSFIAQGSTGEFYQLELLPDKITCQCHAFSGISKAFEQDAKANWLLKTHERMQSQVPDKHIFAIWKYLDCLHYEDYLAIYEIRREKAAALIDIDIDDIEF
jgi:hypothetical protein